MNHLEVLQACTIEGTIIKLPPHQLDRKVYIQVKKSLELIGGTWKGGKVFGFVFPNDPTELLGKVCGGDKVNLKKEYQFFATPSDLADRLVSLLEIEDWHNHSQAILEPSAGQGALIEAIRREHGQGVEVYAFEKMDVNRTFLKGMDNVLLSDEPDFLKSGFSIKFNYIIANPPFSKNQDIDHVRKMYYSLAKGGRMVSVASSHWELSSNKKETAFKDWLVEVGAEVQNIDKGSFKQSGTLVGAKIIIINKL